MPAEQLTQPSGEGATTARPASGKPCFRAVLVGIDEFQCLADLSGAARDAALISDALRRTRMSTTETHVDLLATGEGVSPTRDEIVQSLESISNAAGPNDTLLLFFASHGVIVDGKVAIVPADGDPSRPETLVSIEGVQRVFERCRCPRRAMLLDVCQEVMGGEEETEGDATEVATRGVGPYRTRGELTSGFMEGLRVDSRGWTILTSCGPNQLSVESEDLDNHGVFSYYTALGLRGDADMDRDGTVGLGELAQYIANNVPREVRLVTGGFLEQIPELICRGQITPFTDEGAASGDAAPVERRSFTPPGGFWSLWLDCVRGYWPFEPITAWHWWIRGSAFLYGTIMAIEVLIYLSSGPTGRPPAAVLVGLISAVLWVSMVKFAVAAAPLRYHHAGYINATILALWQLAVFIGVVSVRGVTSGDDPDLTTATIHFGAVLFSLICIMVVFGFNVVHLILSLLDLERRQEEGVLRSFFREMEQKWMRAELPCPLPCETFHPRIYLVLWGGVSLILLLLLGASLLRKQISAQEGLAFLRNILLFVLVAWFTSWTNTAYRHIRRKHPKQVKT
jgi:hypothetical protein